MNTKNILKIASCVVVSGCAVSSLLACGGGGGGDGIDQSSDFSFSSDGPENYTLADRHGAVEAGTVGIAASAGLGQAPVRNLYNVSNPAEDATGKWVGEITKSVTFLHAALDDDLRGAGLVPASLATSLAQAGPVLVPDVIHYNPDKPTSYPNGRKLTDQVVDLTIAAALLDLSQGGQTLRTLADLPLNPPKNDVDFKSDFPFLADPHAPTS